MSSETREQILADFQECTGLENVGECITILDQHQWHLLNAVKEVHERLGGGNETHFDSTVPKHSTEAPAYRSTTIKQPSVVKRPYHPSGIHRRHSDSDENNDSDEPRIIKSIPGNVKQTKATTGIASRARVRELKFRVEYKDQTENITMLDNETIRQLQTKIHEKLNISPNRQKFGNWGSRRYDEHTILKDLHLPLENEIHLIATSIPMSNGATRTSTTAATNSTRTNRFPASPIRTTATRLNQDFPLTVVYENKFRKTTSYEVVLKPNSTVAELKREIERLVHLPVRQQNWSDLVDARETDQLQTHIKRRSRLTVRELEPSSNQKSTAHKSDSKHSTFQRPASDDDSMDVDNAVDLESYDDSTNKVPVHFSSTTAASNTMLTREPLIPDRCTDDTVGLEHFSRIFQARYGSTGPILYIGSLEQAIQDSLLTSRNERRPLAIYLHNDRSVCANVFCSQVLASDTIVEYLANNYVVWAWDITTDANQKRLIEAFKRHISPQYAHRITTMEKDAFPLLFILIRSRGSSEIISTVEGKSTPSEALLTLIQSHDLYEQQRQRDAEEEISREQRENLKKQQEDEYNRSLQADLAKEQARLADERRQKEEKAAHEKLQRDRLKEREICTARLPREPSETEKNITRLKIRLPDNEGILLRRFRVNEPLQTLFDYLSSEGQAFGEYKLLSTFPKRDLTQLNRLDTFEQLKLYPQEQLILEPS